jgi:hypothetical protein
VETGAVLAYCNVNTRWLLLFRKSKKVVNNIGKNQKSHVNMVCPREIMDNKMDTKMFMAWFLN